MVTLSPRNTIIVAVLLSAVVGSVTGLGASYIAHTSPTAQTRNFYLFAVDQSFNSSLATGLKADYDFSASVITVNRATPWCFTFTTQLIRIIRSPLILP